MPLKQILDDVAADFGFNTSDTSERARIVAKVNQAAREIYNLPDADLPNHLKECYVRVTPNKQMALPPFVGELRFVREGCNDYCTERWELHTMIPRYNKQEWVHKWKNFRHTGYAPCAIEWTNAAPGLISIPTADSSVVVTLTGETEDSNNAIESITMNATTKTWTKNFTNFTSITKNKVNDTNLILTDAEDNEFSILYADQLESRYLLVDVSQYPTNLGCCQCSDGTFIMEILYKPRLNKLENDSDIFPIDGFDEIVALKTKQLFTELEEGKENRAIMMHGKIRNLVKDIAGNKEGNKNRKLSFKRNPVYGNLGSGCVNPWSDM